MKKAEVNKNTKKRNYFTTKECYAIKLHDKRSIIINAFINEKILPGNLEEDVHYRDELPKFDESIAERIKLRR